MSGFLEASGQGWPQIAELTLAFVLSASVGAEREIRQKSAGLRTHTLVGVAAALIMLISKYGFMDVLAPGRVVVDPSRVAAQVVSGIGFIGGGVIFMRRDAVRGLTTAASIWFTAALGMACGAGLPVLAAITTAGYFVVTLVFPSLEHGLLHYHHKTTEMRVLYDDGCDVLCSILMRCAELRFAVDHVRLDRENAMTGSSEAVEDKADSEGVSVFRRPSQGTMTLCMQVKGKRPISQLVATLSDIDGVREVGTVGEDPKLE